MLQRKREGVWWGTNFKQGSQVRSNDKCTSEERPEEVRKGVTGEAKIFVEAEGNRGSAKALRPQCVSRGESRTHPTQLFED